MYIYIYIHERGHACTLVLRPWDARTLRVEYTNFNKKCLNSINLFPVIIDIALRMGK